MRSPVACRFVDVFARPSAGVWSAPGRVNLIGEHTDYNDGLCLPIALSRRTYAAAAPRQDDVLRVHSLQNEETVTVSLDEVGPGSPAGWAAYVAGVLWALRRAGHEVHGVDVVVDGRVPLGSGLSSSAALECAVGAAVSDLDGLGLLASDERRTELARACIDAENTVARAPTGGLDQSAALLCRPDHALLLDCRDFSTEQVPVGLGSHDLTLLVMNTRAEHQLVDGQYAERRRSCEEAARRLGVSSLREVADEVGEDDDALQAWLDRLEDDVLERGARHVVTEIGRVRTTVHALRSGDMETVGRAFRASHASLRDDYEVSCLELDVAVAAAEDAGALGARMTGGGFGGSAIALVPEDRVEAAVSAVESAFAEQDLGRPECFTTEPSAPAGRESSG